MKIAIVIPCHIKLTEEWITSLQREAVAGNADVIIVDDSDGELESLPAEWRRYNYFDQAVFLGDLYDEFAKFFHHQAACRVFGHILAYSEGYDVIIGLDSDCIVQSGFVAEHLKYLGCKITGGWENPLRGTGYYSRGYPYFMRNWKIVANMGLWNNVLDINGKDRSKTEPTEVLDASSHPALAPIPFSGGNFAMLREAVPGFFFIPNFEYGDDKFRRIDDIWGGYIFQRLMRKRHEGMSYGQPITYHDTTIDIAADTAAEEAMYKWEESFIERVDMAIFLRNDEIKNKQYDKSFKVFVECFKNLSSKSPQFKNMIPAMEWWVKVWDKYGKQV